jgi:glycosyltransferase involved in cell wall biosynthesis
MSGLASVIMPSFNHEKFVARAMRSVSDQTYPDIEFLIVDDCSTDSTFEIIQRLARSPRFSRRFRKLIVTRSRRNMGAHHTLNLGLAAASGEFITFINSDDAYEPERLHRLISRRSSADTAFLAFSAVSLIDGRGEPIGQHKLKEILEHGPKRLGAELPSISFAFLRHQLTGSTGNIFVNRALLTKVGGFSPLKYCHDWEFMLRAIAITEPCHVPETSYKYRIHGANTFSDLEHLADDDTAAVLASYYRLVASGQVRNSQAPTPGNWPYVFEMIARQLGVYDAWLREASYRPHYALRQATLHGKQGEGGSLGSRGNN